VARIVAGPGVSICNECVDLAASVSADTAGTTPEESARRRSRFRDRPAAEILALLPALSRSASRVDAELAGRVGRLRRQGTDWPTIAAAVETSAEAARRRFEPGAA